MTARRVNTTNANLELILQVIRENMNPAMHCKIPTLTNDLIKKKVFLCKLTYPFRYKTLGHPQIILFSVFLSNVYCLKMNIASRNHNILLHPKPDKSCIVLYINLNCLLTPPVEEINPPKSPVMEELLNQYLHEDEKQYYILVPQALSYDSAISYCKLLNGTLASVTDQGVLTHLLQVMGEPINDRKCSCIALLDWSS